VAELLSEVTATFCVCYWVQVCVSIFTLQYSKAFLEILEELV